MAVFNEPTKWQTSLVNSGDANVIPQSTPVGTGEASFDDGFPQITQVPIGAGGIAPDRKDFNGLFKILGDWIFFAQNGGISTYSENFDYVAGRVVSYNDNIYLCIQDNSALNKHAPTDTEYWLRFALNNELADYLPLAGGNVTGNLSVQNKNLVRSVNGVNADNEGNVTITASVMPDYNSKVSLTNESTYIAPCDCLVCVYADNTKSSDAQTYLYVLDSDGNEVFAQANRYYANGNYSYSSVNLPIPKGTKFKVSWLGDSTKSYACYFPYK